MYIESIFIESFNEVQYLYWYSVQDNHKQNDIKNVEIDEKHLSFFEECIDKSFRPEDIEAEIIMIPNKIRKVMSYEY